MQSLVMWAVLSSPSPNNDTVGVMIKITVLDYPHWCYIWCFTFSVCLLICYDCVHLWWLFFYVAICLSPPILQKTIQFLLMYIGNNLTELCRMALKSMWFLTHVKWSDNQILDYSFQKLLGKEYILWEWTFYLQSNLWV